MEHFKRISRRVSYAKEQTVTCDILTLFCPDTAKLHAFSRFFRITNRYPGHLRFEADLSPEFFYLISYGWYDLSQSVCAYMRMRACEDVLICAALYEGLKHESQPAFTILYPCIQLAVGESAGSSLSELHVRLRIKQSCTEEFFHIGGSLLHAAASLINDGLAACT